MDLVWAALFLAQVKNLKIGLKFNLLELHSPPLAAELFIGAGSELKLKKINVQLLKQANTVYNPYNIDQYNMFNW